MEQINNQEPIVVTNTKSGVKAKLIILTGLIILLAAISWTYFYFKSHPSKIPYIPFVSQVNSAPTSYAAVQITPSGFIPTTIKVNPNTQITWTNTDQKFHQIASDPYPANNSFPPLNSAVLKQEATFSVTFTKPGTYTYHDEIDPLKVKGTIIVQY